MKKSSRFLKVGVDAGSTTLKAVVLDDGNNIIFSEYLRHHADIYGTLLKILKKVKETVGNSVAKISVTGSAGMGISERIGIRFIQEVVASAEAAKVMFGRVGTLLDIGGEDSKIVFFNSDGNADIRMNGNCAGGTGSFIDQMASLMNISTEKLGELACDYGRIYPIASRCGVFAKTDVQNLLSRDISKNDIAASVFNAVVTQILNTLSRGSTIKAPIVFSGGPLAFLPFLRDIFLERIRFGKNDALIPERPELLPAYGCACSAGEEKTASGINEIIDMISEAKSRTDKHSKRLEPLFESEEHFRKWIEKRYMKVDRGVAFLSEKREHFIGIDAGSTTTKIAVVNSDGEIIADYYGSNEGAHINSVKKGLSEIYHKTVSEGVKLNVRSVAVTGYGEDLIKAVFAADLGVVETLAHLKAAEKISENNVDFILDIGGQDMKAIFVDNGSIRNIEINEACSSGCGSFIQTFSESLDINLEDFTKQGCLSKAPCDLGSRCTVFMNSKVKQALKEGASVGDISAGLAFSVVRNSLYKVLKIKDLNELGDVIVLQGGTFKNPCVHRAFEILTEKKVIVPDIAGLMGAYGAALYALENWNRNREAVSDFKGFRYLDSGELNITKTNSVCRGCENACFITKMTMADHRVFYTGNKCEKVFSSGGKKESRNGFNLVDWKRKMLFDRKSVPETEAVLSIGIPRALNIYENYPFWHTLFTECGIRVVLSDPSTTSLYEASSGSIMSDNICFPAKLMHGHIMNLAEKQVDRIFYPMVVYEGMQNKNRNSFNCPIVSGYPDVIKSSINPEKKLKIPFDIPAVSFKDKALLEKKLAFYFTKLLRVSHSKFRRSFSKAMEEKTLFKKQLADLAEKIITDAESENRKVVLLIGRPYHVDPFINHKIPEMISDYGFDVITGDSIRKDLIQDINVLDQWEYPNRLYNAAWYAAEKDSIIPVELNSFGCGPDAIAVDEVREILKSSGKNLTVIRIDEVASPGSARLRLRTLFESLENKAAPRILRRKRNPVLKESDMNKQILVPFFANFYSPFVERGLKAAGLNVVSLPEPDEYSLREGLKYANNEICYPAIIIVGDIIKALKSGRYDLKNTVVGITQTGGQCRASNYLSMIGKAMISAGFGDIPIVSFSSTGRIVSDQPRLKFKRREFFSWGLKTILLGDAISRMYHAVASREKMRGEAKELADSLVREWNDTELNISRKHMVGFLSKAIDGFNSIEVGRTEKPKIGIVGEIYVKYSAFANHDIVQWLMDQGVEPVLPDLVDFFVQEILNPRINSRENLARNNMMLFFLPLMEKYFTNFQKKVEKEMERFRFSFPYSELRDLSNKASRILSLVNQFGEGWLIAAEIAFFAENGINDIICLQPFGCIANQVVAKGVEKKMKDLYPDLNILFIDLDSDTSQANMINRVHFIVRNAKNRSVHE